MSLAGLCLSPAPDAPAASLPLAKAQAILGCTGCVVNAETIDIGDGTNRVRFFPGRRRTEVNGSTVWLNAIAEPAGTSDLLKLDARDVREVLLPLLRPPPAPAHPLRVMLDPGHGGEDSGAVSARPVIEEKDLVLDLALRIGKLLEEAGLVVGYTRRDDTFLSLDERTATATVWRADAFVSLHANFAGNRQAVGPETYVLPFAGYAPTGGDQRISSKARKGNRHDIGNTLLGYSIHRRMPGRRGECDRGLRRARFQVLRQAGCPAVLVEVGFLSNAVEARLLASGWFRGRLARAVADGILDYARPPEKDEGYLPGIEALLAAPVVTDETPAVAGARPDVPAVAEEAPADAEEPDAAAVVEKAPAAIGTPAVTAAVEEATAAIGTPAVTAALEEANVEVSVPVAPVVAEEAPLMPVVAEEAPVVAEEAPAVDVDAPLVPAVAEEVPVTVEAPLVPAVAEEAPVTVEAPLVRVAAEEVPADAEAAVAPAVAEEPPVAIGAPATQAVVEAIATGAAAPAAPAAPAAVEKAPADQAAVDETTVAPAAEEKQKPAGIEVPVAPLVPAATGKPPVSVESTSVPSGEEAGYFPALDFF